MQERPEIKMYYLMGGQPVIQYPSDVEKLDAEQAINKYKPDTVIGCFITHKFDYSTNSGNAFGVQEEFIIKNVRRYINVGNLETHRLKPTRSVDQSKNRIWVHEKIKNKKIYENTKNMAYYSLLRRRIAY